MHLVFLENEQQIRGKGNEGESQNPHQTLVIINLCSAIPRNVDFDFVRHLLSIHWGMGHL